MHLKNTPDTVSVGAPVEALAVMRVQPLGAVRSNTSPSSANEPAALRIRLFRTAPPGFRARSVTPSGITAL